MTERLSDERLLRAIDEPLQQRQRRTSTMKFRFDDRR
jgi:hypothetical protein